MTTNIIKLANKLQSKYSQKVETSQSGTTELFFTNEQKQKAFHASVTNPSSSVNKALLDFWNKKQVPCEFKLSMTATPGSSAKWELTTIPAELKAPISVALNNEYKKIMNVSMPEKQKEADSNAKKGAGSGTLEVTSLALG